MGDPHRETFGTMLQRLRTAAGLSQEALAERAGLSARGISDLERGRRRVPHPETVHLLAEALGLDAAARAAFGVASRPSPPASELATVRHAHAHARAARASASFRGDLPPHGEPLIGREREVADICAMLRQPDARLVTLTGPGGVGKTRLAQHVAAQLAEERERPVIFIALAPLSDAVLVIPAIADALGVRESRSAPLLETLITRLQHAPALLVLDNVEHVLLAAPAVSALLANCPNLQVLATSRAALNLRPERLFDVAPLTLPKPGVDPAADDVERFGAIALFVDRVRIAQARFTVSSANIAVINAICQRLDGLPLAIELAAARMRTLSPQELLAQLDRRLPMLTGGARDLPVRHQALRDTIAWSYDLLSADERAIFRHMSICAGGSALDAVAAIASDQDAQDASPNLLDLLGALIDHSLVRRVERENRPERFEMLETIREFGLEQLAIHDEVADIGQRHATYFLAFIEQQGFDRLIADEAVRLARVDEDYDNVRTALRWCIEQRDADRSLQFCAGLRQYWAVRG